MNAYIMLLLMQSISMLSLFLGKKFQLGIKPIASHLFQANLVSAVVACVCLWIANGFKINVNTATLVFSLFYGLLSNFSVFFMVFAYNRISITLTSIIGMSGGIITPMCFGILLGNEVLTPKLIISALLILTAAILPVMKDIFKKTDLKFIWFLLAYFIFSGLPNILNKLYTQNPDVTDKLSYFFLTNAVMFIICVIAVSILYLRSRKTGVLEKISAPMLLNSSSRTVLSLFSSYLSVSALALLPVSLYSVLTASLGLIGNAVISNFIFKEKMTASAKLSLVLALLSIIIGG